MSCSPFYAPPQPARMDTKPSKDIRKYRLIINYQQYIKTEILTSKSSHDGTRCPSYSESKTTTLKSAEKSSITTTILPRQTDAESQVSGFKSFDESSTTALLSPRSSCTESEMQTKKPVNESGTTTLIPTGRSYAKFGIGGAGNFRKVSEVSPARPRPVVKTVKTNGWFLTGIGGAGNCYKIKERATTSHHEVLLRRAILQESKATNRYYGIGGVGNRASSIDGSTASSVASSKSSNAGTPVASGADKITETIVRYFVGKPKSNNCDVSTVLTPED